MAGAVATPEPGRLIAEFASAVEARVENLDLEFGASESEGYIQMHVKATCAVNGQTYETVRSSNTLAINRSLDLDREAEGVVSSIIRSIMVQVFMAKVNGNGK